MKENTAKKVAIVTGGATGIGLGIVKELINNDYVVIVNYNKSINEALEIEKKYNNIKTYQADISDSKQAVELVNFTIKEFKKIDLLVNNAGIDMFKTLTEISDIEFDKIIKTNLYSAFYLSREVAKYMINQKEGNIINISSIWASTGASCEMPYSVSKAGMDAMTKSLAKELGPSNIRVNSIAPGIIDTKMNEFLTEEEKNTIVKNLSIERIGTPEDIAKTVLFLENNSYITGQIINVNGGWN